MLKCRLIPLPWKSPSPQKKCNFKFCIKTKFGSSKKNRNRQILHFSVKMVFFCLAFIAGGLFIYNELTRHGIKINIRQNMIICMFAGVLCSKIQLCISNYLTYGRFIFHWGGKGMCFQGGFIGAVSCLYISIKYIHKQPLGKIFDVHDTRNIQYKIKTHQIYILL